ncbi:MAG: NAD(P)-dependent oxidoreductase [Hahellaceae bacterium]|nr:NAD(P)-dependent oxidoreductase [Hahellaceae bacterium]
MTHSSRFTVAFIGLGVMGYPMAGHLVRAGFPVTVFNRSPEKSQRWVDEFGGRRANSLHELASANLIISCIGNDADLTATYLGENGLLNQLHPGTLIVDHTTASATIAETLFHTAAKKQIGFVDAPVSGGEQGAIKGQLTIMCGGTEHDFNQIEPVISHYARSVRRLGPTGFGQKTKMVNQIAIAGLLQGLAEAIAFAERAGLPTHEVIDVISKGAAQSWQMENRHRSMLEGVYNHGFAVDWMRKDLGIVFDEARRNGSSLPVTALVDQFYAEVQANGGGKWDTSSLLTRLIKAN